MPWRRTISARSAGGWISGGAVVSACARTLASSTKSSKPPGVRIQTMRQPSGPMSKRCGMPRGPYACWPGVSSTTSSPTMIETEPSST